ncbi:flagellin N-terminal helical domain-containing protein [Salibacterium aidingense]|uniref:flagellin N-terminal helical domain-containing protein n=1 Tax=Salibacterium aidingense TaxID=384933 RepID=UPI003BD8988C
MIINSNIPALNTYNQLGKNNDAMQSSMEKLSSGQRINKAGDDAAGLAISEKMRGQIRGLDQSSRNAQDGISMIQTAEGALQETQSILQRMRELSVQSANDTNTESDRQELQKEVNQLSEEISRIGNNTEFNTQNLVDGSLDDTSFQIGANEDQNLSISIDDMRGFALGVAGDATMEVASSVTSTDGTTDIGEGTYTINDNSGTYEMLNSEGDVVATSSNGQTYAATNGDDEIDFSSVGSGSITSGTVEVDDSSNVTAEDTINNKGLEAGTYTYDSGSLLDSNGNTIATETAANDGTFEDTNGNEVLSIGNSPAADAEINVGGIDISNQESANESITTIQSAIDDVSAQRAELGAYQNRLDHTISNLDNSSENLQAAESRIRDVDMAKEMMEQTRANVLSQASQSMLAQANQQPQSVLQLLQ